MYHFLKADSNRFSRRLITIVTIGAKEANKVQTADLL